MTRSLVKGVYLIAVCFIVGCASGPSFQEIESKIPQLKPGQGRFVFYREALYAGSAIQPDVTINGTKVGKSVPGGFFFVDRNAGKYTIHCSSDTLSLELRTGEIQYIEMLTTTSESMFWELQFTHVTEAQARRRIKNLSYIGDISL